LDDPRTEARGLVPIRSPTGFLNLCQISSRGCRPESGRPSRSTCKQRSGRSGRWAAAPRELDLGRSPDPRGARAGPAPPAPPARRRSWKTRRSRLAIGTGALPDVGDGQLRDSWLTAIEMKRTRRKRRTAPWRSTWSACPRRIASSPRPDRQREPRQAAVHDPCDSSLVRRTARDRQARSLIRRAAALGDAGTPALAARHQRILPSPRRGEHAPRSIWPRHVAWRWHHWALVGAWRVGTMRSRSALGSTCPASV